MLILISLLLMLIAQLWFGFFLSLFFGQEFVIFLVFFVFPLVLAYLTIKDDNFSCFFILNLPLWSHVAVWMFFSLLFSLPSAAFADELLEIRYLKTGQMPVWLLDIDEGGNGGHGVNDNKVSIAADTSLYTNHEEMVKYNLSGDYQSFNKHSKVTGYAKFFHYDEKLTRFHESHTYLHFIYQIMSAPPGTAIIPVSELCLKETFYLVNHNPILNLHLRQDFGLNEVIFYKEDESWFFYQKSNTTELLNTKRVTDPRSVTLLNDCLDRFKPVNAPKKFCIHFKMGDFINVDLSNDQLRVSQVTEAKARASGFDFREYDKYLLKGLNTQVFSVTDHFMYNKFLNGFDTLRDLKQFKVNNEVINENIHKGVLNLRQQPYLKSHLVKDSSLLILKNILLLKR